MCGAGCGAGSGAGCGAGCGAECGRGCGISVGCRSSHVFECTHRERVLASDSVGGTTTIQLKYLMARETDSSSDWNSVRCSSIHIRWSSNSDGDTKRTKCARHTRIGIRRAAFDSPASCMSATRRDGARRPVATLPTPTSPSETSASTSPRSCAARQRFAKVASPARSRIPACGRWAGWGEGVDTGVVVGAQPRRRKKVLPTRSGTAVPDATAAIGQAAARDGGAPRWSAAQSGRRS